MRDTQDDMIGQWEVKQVKGERERVHVLMLSVHSDCSSSVEQQQQTGQAKGQPASQWE